LGPHLAKKLIKEGHNVFGILRGTRGSEQEIKDLLSQEEFEKLHFQMGKYIMYVVGIH
jgi:nucleoside-diphosphate-sugar epimerase